MIGTPTKKPKKIKVEWTEKTYTAKESKYTCPCCHATYINTVQKRDISFRCNCGQVLVIENV